MKVPNMAKCLVTIVIHCFCLSSILVSAVHFSLEGNDWNVYNQNQSIRVKAKVPGSIYSDLRRDNILKQDLYYGNNDVNYRWVSYDNWTYERTFEVDETLIRKSVIQLTAHGIDTVSKVYINDILVGQTDNMFVRYRFDLKKALNVGTNKIRIAFESAVTYGKTQSDIYKKTYNYSVPPDCPNEDQHGECHSNFIRKMQSSFSWDWGPAFPTQGIWKTIGIEAYDKAILRDVAVQPEADPKYIYWALTINAIVETSTLKPFNATFNIRLYHYILVANQSQLITPDSDYTAKVTFYIPINETVELWFPNGVADNLFSQSLYELDVKITFPDSEEQTSKSVRFGFRVIELIQDPIEPVGLTFYFKVNGLPFFAKGSNWIPANVLNEDISKEYVRHLLESAKEANMNMLRVWGGGVYESDYFYELADELGIMIWQDFMFACALYPTDPNFLKSVDIEITQQVRRLQHHPSIAIWAGNNENEGLLSGPFKDEIYKKDYRELYSNHIRNILQGEDCTRSFVGSSPSNGLETQKENWTAKNPQDTRYGDVHFYSYDKPLWDWTIYPSPKFASEFGFESYPSLETLSRVIDESDLTYPISQTLDHHQHHPSGTQQIEKEISNYLNLPSNGGKDRLNDLIYLSQITQAMAMKTETEFYRRNREIDPKTGNGNTMGALFWQLNDIWEGPTWASIEFGGKWKILQSYAKNFFKNQLVTAFEDADEMFKVAIVRDDILDDLLFNVTIKVYKWSQLIPVQEWQILAKTKSLSSRIVFALKTEEVTYNCLNKNECVVLVEIENLEHKLYAHNFMLLSEPKNSKIVKPNLKLVDVKQNSTPDRNRYVYDITLTSEAVAPFVYMDFELNSGIRGHFPDNGFFIFKSPKTIQFVSKFNITAEQLKENLTFKTLTDVV